MKFTLGFLCLLGLLAMISAQRCPQPPEGNCGCSNKLAEVCSSHQCTYRNQCLLECAKQELAFPSRCLA